MAAARRRAVPCDVITPECTTASQTAWWAPGYTFAVAEGQAELVIEKWPKGFGFSTDDDCLVTGCGGAAADAGVTVGSVIVAVAGQSVASKADIVKQVRGLPPDTTEVAFVLQVCTHMCWAVVALCVGHGPDPELLAATAGGIAPAEDMMVI